MLKAEVQYLANISGRPIYSASNPGRNASFTVDQEMVQQEVEIFDGRNRSETEPSIFGGQSPSGFDLISHQSAVTKFLEESQIKRIYETELSELLKSFTGAYRVHLFDHTIRASDSEIREKKNIREPATLVHNDYTAKSGFKCLQENLPDEAELLSKGRFQIINIWRPLVDPVVNFPLALCDARGIKRDDLVDAERRAANHTGEILLAAYSPDHQWYYFPKMCSNEVLLFKTFDSINRGKNISSIHTAINIPGTPENAPPRESIESRAFVFYQ